MERAYSRCRCATEVGLIYVEPEVKKAATNGYAAPDLLAELNTLGKMTPPALPGEMT